MFNTNIQHKIKKYRILNNRILLFGVIFVIMFGSSYQTIYAESDFIPDWVKSIALWWGQEKISDEEFFNLIQFLVDDGIITMPDYGLGTQTQQPESELEQMGGNYNTNFGSEIEDRGDFKLALRETEIYQWEYELLNSRLTEEVDYLNSYLKLPYDISVIADECYESNAFYHFQSRTIMFCYELVSEFYEIFSNEEFFVDISDEAVYEAIDSNVIETFYHEIGHMMFDVWEIPFTGLEENVADQFAVYLIWFIYDDESVNSILYDVGNYYWAKDNYIQDYNYIQDQSDVHALDLQRFYNVQCYAYGFDKDNNQDLITDEWLPLSRSHNCEYEFQSIVYGFSNIFEDYMLLKGWRF